MALAGLSRLSEVSPDLLGHLAGTPRWARQLIVVLGASASLGQHLIAHPEQVDVLNAELSRTPVEQLRAELLTAVGAERDSMPVASDLSGDGLRLAYRRALLRIAARDLTAPEPIEIFDDVAGELSDLADATLEAALAIAEQSWVGMPATAGWRWSALASPVPGAQLRQRCDILFVAEPRDRRGTASR